MEHEEFIFRLRNRVNGEMNAGVAAVSPTRTIRHNTGIRTERIVDHTTALFTVGSDNILSQLSPAVPVNVK